VATRYHNLGPAIGNNIEYNQTDPFPGRLQYAYLSRRFKFVMINSCMGAGGFLHLAFGMPNGRFTFHGSAYLGFRGLTYPDVTLEFTKKFWNYLSQRLNVHAAAEYAKQDTAAMHPGDPRWLLDYEIFGDPRLALWR